MCCCLALVCQTACAEPESLLCHASRLWLALSRTQSKVKEASISELEYQRPAAPMQQGSIRQVKPVDVFQYAIPKPVSVKRGQSALVSHALTCPLPPCGAL